MKGVFKMKLTADMVLLGETPENKTDAINRIGKVMVQSGLVSDEYIEGMHMRDEQLSVFMGNDIAIPHGTDDHRKYVKNTGIVVMQAPEGVDFDNNKARLLFGIAAKGEEHMDILSNIAILCSDIDTVDELVALEDAEALIKIIKDGE